jgi:urease accessory protein
MRATARMVAHAAGDGGTRLAVLRGEPPLLLRHTPSPGPDPATVHLLGGAAGPIGGDELRLEIEVGAGASLDVRGVAASIALPGRSASTSYLMVVVKIAEGGCLRWLAEPLIAAASCRHEALSSVDMEEGARLIWREELICGRHGEPPGDATVATSLTYGGKPLLRQALRVGPQAPGHAGPGVLAGAKAVGSLILAGPPSRSGNLPGNSPPERTSPGLLPGKLRAHEREHGREHEREYEREHGREHGREHERDHEGGVEWAWMELAGPGWMLSATARQAARLRSALTPAWLSAA